MSVALEYIFKKHWYVIAGMFLVFGLLKYFLVTETQDMYTNIHFQPQWKQEMYDLNMDERKVYLENLMEALHQIANDSASQQFQVNVNGIHSGNIESAIAEYCELNADYNNQQELYNLIQFAQKQEGILPIVLPDNYLELLDFYADIEEPRLINEKPLNIYFYLQELNLIPLFAFFVMAVYFSIHYETQVYKYTLTTPQGKSYNRYLKWILVVLFLGLLLFNEVFDLLYSGVLFDNDILQASVQSYSEFQDAQLHATIGTCIFYSFIAKIVGLLVIFQLTDLIAWITKNTKDTMVGGAFLFLFLFLFTSMVETGDSVALIQIGIVNWKTLISNISVYMPMGSSYATLGFGISLAVLTGSSFFLQRLHRRF